MNSIALRPRTATEIVDATFRVCREHYGALATVVLVINAPALLLGIFPPTQRVAEFAQNVLFTVADGAVIAMVSDVYLGRRAETGRGLRALQGRIGSLVGASILRNLVVIIGLILLIVPGLFMLAATFAVPMMIVVEGRSVSESFARSQRLVAANLWHVVRTLALLAVIVLGLFGGFAVMLGFASGLFAVGETAVASLLNVVLTLLYPLFSVGGTLLYYDLRIRTEGLDLEMMLEALGSEPTRTAAPATTRPVS